MKRFNWFGLVIIAVGVLWLLSGLGVNVEFGKIVWPAIVAIVALSSMAAARRVSFFWLAVLCFSVYWALVRLGYFLPVATTVWVPVLVIILGVSIFLPHGYRRVSKTKVSDGGFKSTAIFGSDNRAITGEEFMGGSVVTVFGGSELNLCAFASYPAETVISCTCVFGGIELVLPSNVRVKRNNLLCVFGGMATKGQPDADAQSVVELEGIALFGGVEVIYANANPGPKKV